jgi:hypothetical protein
MAAIEPTLFTWEEVEARCDLERFFLVRDHLPDEQIINYLEVMRGQGRDDFPVRAMWNAVIAGIVFQHPSIEALIRKLSRNRSLLQACGFEVLPVQKKALAKLVRDTSSGRVSVAWSKPQEAYQAVPVSWNFSRFLSNVIELEQTLGLVTGMIPNLREQLMEVLPDFGQHLGFDGKAIESHSTGRVNRDTGARSDPDADWGKHETGGIDARTGKPWTKVKSGFGYGLHLMADTHYEIPVAVPMTPASASEQVELRAMIRESFQHSPELAERCQDFSADRGLDSAETKALLWDEYRIRPLVDTRALWREEKPAPYYAPSKPITGPPGQSGPTPSCIYGKGDPALPVPRHGGTTGAGLSRVRSRARHPEIPLSRGGLRPALSGAGPMPPSRRGESWRLWTYRAHPYHPAGPAHLRTHSLRQPLLAAWLSSAQHLGAHQPPH